MPCVARIVIPGLPHHITQRGNNRQDVFFVDDDRRTYLELLAEQSERFGLEVLGYCLMVNHVHLVATPSAEESLARAVGRFVAFTDGGRTVHVWRSPTLPGWGQGTADDGLTQGRHVGANSSRPASSWVPERR